jgi:signal transduction histidine kinase
VRAYSSDRQIHVQFRNPCRKGRSINSEKLFLPFDEGGQSIGLPLCYRLVKSMGGILSFAQEGEQALFTVSLPTEVDEEREVRGLRRMPLAETVSGDH